MNELRLFILLLLLIIELWVSVESVGIYDTITIGESDTEYRIVDEVYEFLLVPSFEVPMDITGYTIYTASSEVVARSTKRYLARYKRSLEVLSYEDYMILKEYLGEEPPFLMYDENKRSLKEYREDDIRVIQLSDKAKLTYKLGYDKKRSVPIGTQICIHIPFITQCDNSAAYDAVKDALEAQINATREQIDNIKSVSEARWRDLEAALEEQNQMFSDIAANLADQAATVKKLTNTVTYQSLEMVHSDNVIAAHIQHLQYIASSISTFANALQSTDPRSVVVQPSLIELFEGYKRAIAIAIDEGDIPIVTNKTFSFKEALLPTDSVANKETPEGNYTNVTSLYKGFGMHINGTMRNFIGTFLPDHPAIAFYENGTYYQETDFFQSGNSLDQLNCFSLFGYTVLTDADLNFFSEIANGPKVSLDISKCNIHRLKEGGPGLYQYFIEHNYRILNFYSNCKKVDMNLPSAKYFGNYPGEGVEVIISNVDVNERHFISDECYLNIPPTWVGSEYYFPTDYNRTIDDIPFGFKIVHFTTNTDGEISSSLKFMKTSKWITVYDISRISNNSVIVDEVDDLDSDKVLFYIDPNTNEIIDASEPFTEGFGRACVIKDYNYDEKITECRFQNNEMAYPAFQYLNGNIVSTGIARYNNKFNLDIRFANDVDSSEGYIFTLTPKPDTDFNFYVQLDEDICPTVTYNGKINGRCLISIEYRGSGELYGNEITLTPTTNQGIVRYYEYQIPEGDSVTLSSNASTCVVVRCSSIDQTFYVAIQSVDFNIITDDLENLVSDEGFIHNITKQIEGLSDLEKELALLEAQLNNISTALSNLNFNISDQNPYGNYSYLRDEVDRLLQEIEDYEAINTNSEQSGCDGIFGTIDCFLADAASTLIVVAIVGGLVLASYCFVTKVFC
eukprot:TRINITY_DN6426_c0_g1_i1.p1 TRINITY_DN6426_c0_g1~~TRINITY_DN6426_c0_g1_i1.p1  ORF type:complete len:906 (+),score=170.19 TRINITY_DN6426_c0_g1_i1:19-2736(+)